MIGTNLAHYQITGLLGKGGMGTDIWIIDLQRGPSTRVRSDPGDDAWPIFSADGTQIAFTSDRDGTWGIYTKPANGAAAEPIDTILIGGR